MYRRILDYFYLLYKRDLTLNWFVNKNQAESEIQR